MKKGVNSTVKKRKLIPLTLILSSVIVFVVFAPRFLFPQARISHELNAVVESIRLDITTDGVKTVKFRGRWSSMFAKLELSTTKYDQVKQKLLLFVGTVSNKDLSDDIISEKSRYRYDEKRFISELSTMTSRKDRILWLQSMNLDDYEELIIMETTYAKYSVLGGTTGGRFYVLVKENSGSCYLYIIKI